MKKKNVIDEGKVSKEDTDEKKDETKEGKKEELVEFSFKAFLFTFAHFIYRKQWKRGLIFFLITLVVPLREYFIIGLCAGFSSGKYTRSSKKIDLKYLFIACIFVVLFCVGKVYENKIFGWN